MIWRSKMSLPSQIQSQVEDQYELLLEAEELLESSRNALRFLMEQEWFNEEYSSASKVVENINKFLGKE
jgi:hypothetical protein